MSDIAADEILGKAYDARLMRRLLAFLWPHWRAVVVAFVAIVATSLLALVPPFLIRQVIDVQIPAGDLDGLAITAALYLATLVAQYGAEFVQTWTLQMTGQRIMFDLRMAIYAHLQRLDLRFYDRNPVGRLMTRVTTDVDALNDLFTAGVVSVFGDVFTLAGIMGVMLWLDWQLALVAFSVLPLIVIATQWFRLGVRESYRAVRMWIARINAFLQENITGMATVQLFRREGRNFEAFDALDRGHLEANLSGITYYAVFYPLIEIIAALATALLIWFGGGDVIRGTVTLGTLVAFIQYGQRFFRPISDLSEKFNVLQAAMASSERIFGLLDTPVEISSPEAGRVPAPVEGPGRRTTPSRIEFDHVWFAYTGEDWVLRDVSFVIEPGERVGIVGATGAGKTTVISLLLRFYDVSRGRILLDGRDIRTFDLHALRRHFSLVLQDVHLFSGTIAANIRLGESGIGDEAVRAAAAAVKADRFIDELPGGFDAPVAERGATLSVGQKQLLSFARALAFNPPVLVLDEATSSVDTETEILIREALGTLMRDRTTVAIAHRLSTIQDMDRILVFHKGHLRESGSHQALLAERGLYYRLFALQFNN
ncbi:MAG: ABC transporter ATP-binding protein [Vicinamibacterales bacterium]